MRVQANMVWAYATNGHNPGEAFLEALASHAWRTLPAFSPQNISNTVWALATLAFHSPVPPPLPQPLQCTHSTGGNKNAVRSAC